MTVFEYPAYCPGHDEVGRNLTDPLDAFLRGKRWLILDRDQKFTTEFRNLLEHAETDVLRLPHRSPNLNAYVERFVLSALALSNHPRGI